MADLPVYKLLISEDEESDLQVDFVALVDRPAIERNFIAFSADEVFVEPGQTETESEFISRCIGVLVGEEGYEQDQAAAVCYSKWKDRQKFAGLKVSFDYDDTLSTDKGKEFAKNRIADGDTVYIISARNDKEGMLSVAKDLGIPESRVYATGSNSAKVEKIKELGINKHYDNNADVISAIGNIGIKFSEIHFESYSDYPDAVKNNAKAALKWADENGWGSCGTPVGKLRANQLANGEPISLDTIKRMYSFLSRHKDNAEKSKGYGDGCGQLMYDAWGGASALSWAESKIRQAEKMRQVFAIDNEEQRIISGALILADTNIYRRDDAGEYYVRFPKETIKDIVLKFYKKGYQKNVNIMHDSGMTVEGLTMFESWIKDSTRGIGGMKGFEDVPDGSWFGSFKVENDEVWKMVKEGKVKGFSVEGIFNYSRAKTEEDMKMEAIIKILEEYGNR